MADWLFNMLEETVSSGSITLYFFVFAGGVLASFTPCTYPVLPLTVGYVGAASEGKRGRALILSLALVFGMALVYAVVGTIFAAFRMQFGAIWGNGWAVFAIAWFFILMGLFLMDVFSFPVPKFLQKIQAKSGSNRKGIFGAFMVGGVSGLVVGPCTGPILAVVIVAVTTTLQEAQGMDYALQVMSGGLKLFVFGVGQGTLLLLCGVFAGFLTHLPKSGKWMASLKKGFAVLIILGASLLLVFVGQDTDFPNLTRFLAGIESTETTDTNDSNQESDLNNYGGDEFLQDLKGN